MCATPAAAAGDPTHSAMQPGGAPGQPRQSSKADMHGLPTAPRQGHPHPGLPQVQQEVLPKMRIGRPHV